MTSVAAFVSDDSKLKEIEHLSFPTAEFSRLGRADNLGHEDLPSIKFNKELDPQEANKK